MFPIRDENPTTRTAAATFLLVALNVLAWVFVQGLGTQPALLQSVWRYGLVPAELLGRVEPGTVVPLGREMAVVLDGAPKPASLVTSMFMHGGWLHIIMNLWFLLVFGDNVEDAMGRLRFLLFYLLCGVAAGTAQILSHPGSTIPMVGASGAIGGVMGAYLRLYPLAPVQMLVWVGFFIFRVAVPAFFMLGYWFLAQLAAGLLTPAGSGGVAFWAHAGGFAAGFLLVPWFCQSGRLAVCRGRRGRASGFWRRVS